MHDFEPEAVADVVVRGVEDAEERRVVLKVAFKALL